MVTLDLQYIYYALDHTISDKQISTMKQFALIGLCKTSDGEAIFDACLWFEQLLGIALGLSMAE